ncbi:MAG: signal transduction histidine kinase, partial [Myxococcota bacterium]
YNIRSVLCAPMIHGDDVKGCIQLDSLGGGVGFSEEDLELISTIAPVLAVAIENTRLIEAQKRTIAELREAHGKLLKAQQSLVDREKMAIVGRFTSGLAHEIRNLMGPFMLADLLRDEYPDDEQIQESAELMLEAHNRIGSLVEEIRLLARGEASDLIVAEYDLAITLQSVSRFVKCDHQVKRHRILIDVDADLPLMQFDENRMKQVFVNLIRNAVQAMDHAGDVAVRARAVSSGTVSIEVTDQGSGIPAEVVGRIFEPFFSTKDADGTGLGLDICRRIVERHGGTISCKSILGTGTTMTVVLPIANSEA